LALESRALLGIAGALGPEHLERDRAAQPRVGGAIDLAHAAGAERSDDLVRAEPRAARKRHPFPRRIIGRGVGDAIAFVSVSSVVAPVIVVFLIALHAADARAQGIGFVGGGAVDPSQGYVGTHVETAPIGGHLRLRPGIDGAFGGSVSEAIVDFT